jgi:hypothetical protein
MEAMKVMARLTTTFAVLRFEIQQGTVKAQWSGVAPIPLLALGTHSRRVFQPFRQFGSVFVEAALSRPNQPVAKTVEHLIY